MLAKGKGVLFSGLEAAFRARYEEIVACESVTEIGRGGGRGAKPRLLVLSVPMKQGGESATVSVANVTADGKMKIKQVFAVARLADVSHDGSFDATLNFGSSGMISVSYESHIQREMFVAELKKVQREQARGGALQPTHDIQAMVSESVGAAVDADAAARVEKLRQEKRRAFSSEEELHLIHAMRGTSFDDIRWFEAELLKHQKLTELQSVSGLIDSQALWAEVSTNIASMIEDVTEVEQRIEQYSKHLLSKKDTIQQIEHENNTLHRKQQNLQTLYEHMVSLQKQLSLPPTTVALLLRLRNESRDLLGLFSEGRNAQIISEAMKQMQAVLHNEKLEKDYPIAAVVQRKLFFIEQRRMIAQKSKIYLMALIDRYKRQYILSNQVLYYSKSSIVWRPHTDLTSSLESVSDITDALARINMEGFISVLRMYRASVQEVYTVEIKGFFRGLRMQVKKIGSSGPMRIGERDTNEVALQNRLETGVAGETPRKAWQHNGCGVSPSVSTATTATRRMGNRTVGFYDDVGGHDISDQRSRAEEKNVTFDVPAATLTGFPLLSQSVVDHLQVRAARSFLSGVASTIRTMGESGRGGNVRPDIAFAVALETTMEVILHEEYVLHVCFGLGGGRDAESNATAAAPSTDLSSAFLAGPAASSAAPNESAVVNDAEDAEEIVAQADLRLRESLLEIFAGDAVAACGEGISEVGGAHHADTSAAGRDPPISRTASNASISHAASATSYGHKVERSSCLFRELAETTRYFMEHCDRLYSVPMLCMVKAYLQDGTRTARSSMCREILEDAFTVLRAAMTQFIAEQTESIAHCRRAYLVHPTPLLHCFVKLAPLIQRMEAVHNTLSSTVVDRTDYAAIVQSIVDQAFDALDTVTNQRSSEKTEDTKLTAAEATMQKVLFLLDGREAKPKSVKRGFIEQYRHHAFFCAMYQSLPEEDYAREILRDRFEVSRTKRDRFEELYLTRVIFLRHFPRFGSFALSAEDLSRIYSQDELKHHRALSVEAVRTVADAMSKEINNGIRESARRIKKHFLASMVGQKTEEAFHRTLIQVTWEHFSTFLLAKVAFISRLLTWPVYNGIKMPVNEKEVALMLEESA